MYVVVDRGIEQRTVEDSELAELCEHSYPRLVRALTLRTGDAVLAEDLAQQALIRLCEHWPRVSRLDSPMGWAYRVGVNLSTSWFRRRNAERRAVLRLESLAEPRVDAEPSLSNSVRAALLDLPESQRDAVVLRYLLDLSVSQTAEAMQISEESVRVRCHRAKATLREKLRLESGTAQEVVGDVQ